MTTRRRTPGTPLAQGRYMSSPEYSELRGINAVAVKDKAAITKDAELRKLLWFLQAKSLEDGGLKRVTDELLAMFPERIGTMRMRDSKQVDFSLGHLRADLDPSYLTPIHFPWDPRPEEKRVTMQAAIDMCVEVATTERQPDCLGDYHRAPSIEEFIIDLCINPAVTERDDLPYFENILGALFEYQRSQARRAQSGFVHTAISKQLWETLNFGLKSHVMVLIDGLEGRGKTFATRIWCQAHRGEARYVSLRGINSKTAAFREIAKVLGVASSYTRKASEMQARIEDVLERSKLMLVIDEAHWLFNQSSRIYTRPELLDWIVTAICNRGIPIGLVTTPQFLQCMARAVEQVAWNHRQFQRRVRRRVRLPDRNTKEDIGRVTRSVFPKANDATINQIIAYVLLSKRDLSALEDVAIGVRNLLNPEEPLAVDLTAQKISYTQIEQVINDQLLPGDALFAQDLEMVLKGQRTGRPRRARPQPETEILPPEPEAPAVSRFAIPARDARHTRLDVEPLEEATV